jgi:hypothetical protein
LNDAHRIRDCMTFSYEALRHAVMRPSDMTDEEDAAGCDERHGMERREEHVNDLSVTYCS